VRIGGLFRDEHGDMLGVSFKFLDFRSNSQVEIEGLVMGKEEALGRGYKNFKGD
jgi:hypothetical protein